MHERIKPLVEEAKKNLSNLSIDNVFSNMAWMSDCSNIKYDGILLHLRKVIQMI